MKAWLCMVWNTLTDPGLVPYQDSRMPPWLAGVASHAQSLATLGARLFAAKVFWLSGLTKIHDWDTTIALFENEYHVPILPPHLAAYMGTGGELGLSVLLVLGLGGRFAAAGLFILNIVAANSLEDIAPAALMGHELWGTLLAVILMWGAGRWSVDGWLGRRDKS